MVVWQKLRITAIKHLIAVTVRTVIMRIMNHQVIVIMAANRQEKAIILKTNRQKAVIMPIMIHHRTIHPKTHQKDKKYINRGRRFCGLYIFCYYVSGVVQAW